MKMLKLRKVKISRVTNPYLITGGGHQQAQGNSDKNTNTVTLGDCRHTYDDKDQACQEHTNYTGTVGRTGAPASGSQTENDH
ncbi:hypothetical protein [Kordia sp.]|uniref:hypothetical protein n=1 Tax=Kordia sp. TaxID=1965332 RepID=UPI0025C01671|nr:hypothetical protein [Kordia sp.]MCH2192726.1 hypothetical protein [Kordia sp.]